MKKIIISLLLCSTIMLSAQEIPTSFPRKFLLEHFTGDGCGNCPDGMFAIVDHIAEANTPYIWVSHHYGFNNDDYSITENSQIGKYLGVSGAPNMSLNRTKQQMGMAFHPSYLPNITIYDTTAAEASVVINHTFNAETRQLDVTVSGQVADTTVKSYLLSVLIKENKLIGKQADYTYSWKGAGWLEYTHNRTVRDFVTKTFGDTVYVQNQAYSHTLTYTIDEKWVPENCCVVAYITPLNKKPIINAEQAPLVVGTTGGEESYPFGITPTQAPTDPEKITFDSLVVSKPSDDKLLVTLFSAKSVRTDVYGAAKQMLVLEFNTTADALPVDTLSFLSDNIDNTFTAGDFDFNSYAFTGSYLQYVDSKKLAKGEIVVFYTWAINEGEVIVDAAGNISLSGRFRNNKHFTMKYTTPTTAVENISTPATYVEKFIRNGQVIIRKNGIEYNLLGNTLK